MLLLGGHLLQLDRETWKAFRAALKARGERIHAVLEQLVRYYIRHGLPKE